MFISYWFFAYINTNFNIMANYKLKAKPKNKKVTICVTIDEMAENIARNYVKDKRVLVNSFSQYVNIAIHNLNNLNLKKYE